MSGPSISFRLPPLSLFTFPPPPEPPALPAPSASGTLAAPFTIPPALFNSVLDVRWPITIATLYAITAVSLNGVNRRRGFKPWAISKTRAFHAFVILHNVLLAVYSALTFVAMLRALRHSWPSHREYEFLGKMWPGLRTENGIAGAADALCKIHGPRGFGDAVYYNVTGGIWQSKNAAVQLAQDVVAPGVVSPDSRDVGRLWNEGLAFWGWWFYLSKFYEVVDTAIILAKGKRSSTLQTYHHAGAMFCMWAGIRYMGPPIWIFAFINSGIHALMYTYYTLSALRIPVKQVIKRTLTTLQITQFLVGFTFAALHLFVKYTVPVSTPIQVAVNAASSLSSAATAAPSSVSSAFSAAASAATSGIKWLPFLHAGILRAFGEEGLANNALRSGDVLPSMPEVPAHEASQKILNAPTKLKERFQTQYETVYQEVDCIDTAGQSFAVWLNLIYLAPLTVLFVRFFIRSYSRRYAAAKQLHEKQSIGSHRRRLSR
ncbi:hypothetical protein P152DRAFT_159533 [Eremomyces bilateralis CBS 781.70]|uniref:Elongation of fatty acids protein n=1 Tax=Eremomyces bilateralis CBS 781.70 TaxID=1392243 RepID=A0A6G1FUT7_9PEZI|nr:uncharacterized protein P152DRAFT_159533 [Eremomyces bilateralis CBS 781.70]KAF1809520.1 hypothetical protein P152DRAFT_159533 [Eremomyces bilateralis CBS 781.70]